MMKSIALITALGMSTAAYADHHEMDDQLIPMGTSTETEVYDGPDTNTAPGQPAPTDADSRTMATGQFQPTVRQEYPFCSATVRDNCRQRRDPGY